MQELYCGLHSMQMLLRSNAPSENDDILILQHFIEHVICLFYVIESELRVVQYL